jgi:hypothetical protein
MQLFEEHSLPTPEGVTYVPFVDGTRVGYEVRDDSGASPNQYLYFNPTTDTGDAEGVPNVFVYLGYENDPGGDLPLHFYDIPRSLHGTLDPDTGERVEERLS